MEYITGGIQSGKVELPEGNYEMIAYDAAGNNTSVSFTIVRSLKQKIMALLKDE